MISVDKEKQIFTIQTLNSTYQMKVDKYGFLLHTYYGKKAEGNMDYLIVNRDRGFSGNPYDAGDDRTYSLDVLPQEFPCRGSGDYRSPAIDVRYEDGSFGCDLRYQDSRIIKGKYSIPGLPAVYGNECDSETLEIYMCDKVSGLNVCLLYGVLPALDIITRSVRVENKGSSRIYLEKLESACLDFVSGKFDVITFNGRHAMERNMQRTRVSHISQRIASRRGTSSHQYNPMMLLAECDTTEDFGSCYSMSFVYSGGFLGEVECDQYNQTRMGMGLYEEQFSYPLEAFEVFHAPEVILSYSDKGLNKLSGNLHKCIREHVCRGKYRDKPRPVLLNSWEAVYFDFNGEKLINLAKEAAPLGIELLVMDDGWFGSRDSDNSGLGDWYVNEEKLGCPLGELVEKINQEGLKFGIWIEPEMVNEDSNLYRKHPDWVLKLPGRKPVRGRNQLVLDFSRRDVVDEIYNNLCRIFDSANIEYVKWDMNRSINEVFTYGEGHQGKVLYDYVLGVYDLLERLMKRYPDILLEGCSGGGGRFDAGMLYYTPQIWCSDNTDAADRTKIQYGTSFGYPVSSVGAHVSASPNHQTGRETPLCTRGVVAMAGCLGYELDPSGLSDLEKQEIKEQIKCYRKYCDLIMFGDYYRLSNPFVDDTASWIIVSENKGEALMSIVVLENHGNMQQLYVRAEGLMEGALYKDSATGRTYSANALMEAGIPVVFDKEEYKAFQIHLEKC